MSTEGHSLGHPLGRLRAVRAEARAAGLTRAEVDTLAELAEYCGTDGVTWMTAAGLARHRGMKPAAGTVTAQLGAARRAGLLTVTPHPVDRRRRAWFVPLMAAPAAGKSRDGVAGSRDGVAGSRDGVAGSRDGVAGHLKEQVGTEKGAELPRNELVETVDPRPPERIPEDYCEAARQRIAEARRALRDKASAEHAAFEADLFAGTGVLDRQQTAEQRSRADGT